MQATSPIHHIWRRGETGELLTMASVVHGSLIRPGKDDWDPYIENLVATFHLASACTLKPETVALTARKGALG